MPVISCPDCGRDVSTLATACPHCGRPSPTGTAPPPVTVAPIQEETLWRGSPSAVTLMGQVAGIVIVLIGLPLLAHFAASQTTDVETSARIVRIGWLITLLLVVIQAVIVLVALARIRSTIYTITTQRVMIETGLLAKSLGEIDLRYIDDTQFFQRLIDRFLGIGNVTVVSSDKTSPTYVLRSIRDPRTVRELIRSHAYQVSQRQIFTRAT